MEHTELRNNVNRLSTQVSILQREYDNARRFDYPAQEQDRRLAMLRKYSMYLLVAEETLQDYLRYYTNYRQALTA